MYATYPLDADNLIYLNKKSKNIRWSRTQPDSIQESELFCFEPACKLESKDRWMNETYTCHNALGIRDLSLKKAVNYTLIDVYIDNDLVRGFLDRPNIIVSRNGSKDLQGGNLDDIFILHDHTINGVINGLLGINTLELKKFALRQDLKIDLKAKVLASYNSTKYMDVINIHQILGRPNNKDGIVCVCDTHYVDGRGGEGNKIVRIMC